MSNNLYGVDLDMFRALKDLLKFSRQMADQASMDKDQLEFSNAEVAMAQYERSLGPLPVWAKAWNFERGFVQSAQLFTKNGRVCGNGVIAYIEVPARRELTLGAALPIVYAVITDAGNTMKLTQGELEAGFEVGDFLFTDHHIEQMQLRFQPS